MKDPFHILIPVFCHTILQPFKYVLFTQTKLSFICLALVVATTLALCYMAATIPIVLALLLALVAALGLRTFGPLIGATALIELRVSLKDKSEMMHA